MSTPLVFSVTDELVAELERECRTGAYDHAGMGHEEESALFDRIGDVLLALMAERAELKRDAARYQWLRESMWYVGPDTCEPNEGGGMDGYCNENFFSENLDEAIDAAMQSEAKP